MNTKTAVRSVMGFLVLVALVMATNLLPHETFESTAAFALGYSVLAALIPLLALVADDDQRRSNRAPRSLVQVPA